MIGQRFLLVLALSLGVLPFARGALYYVSTSGATNGTGTQSNPLSLQNAIGSGSPAKAGDTVWLRGGTYRGAFTSTLAGQPDNPIIVRQCPGERAILVATNVNDNTLTVLGNSTWFWGFEVMNSVTNRSLQRGMGVYSDGPNTKLINLIVHDSGVGIGSWGYATNSEICGCIIFNNGYTATNGGAHGHGIYIQNNLGGRKLVRNTIISHSYAQGINCYSQGGIINDIDYNGNVIFRNGGKNMSIGGYKPAFGITVSNSVLYQGTGIDYRYTVNVQLGLGVTNMDNFIFVSNTVVGGYTEINLWTNGVVSGNRFIFGDGALLVVMLEECNYVWDANTYFNSTFRPQPFIYHKLPNTVDSHWTLSGWQAGTGFDTNSSLTTGIPSGPNIIIQADPYDTNRTTITVLNWESNAVVAVDMSGRLSAGQRYEVRNVQDYFAGPVVTGTYSGGTISLPMTNLSVAIPIGVTNVPASTGPVFNVFVLMPPPPSVPTPPSGLTVLH
jgi:hypothetical protein